MKILIDLDDTFWDFMHPVLNHINAEHCLSIQKEDCKSWSYLYENLDLKNPFACTECAEFWDEVFPFENAVEAISLLAKDGHEIYFVTASGFTNGLSPKIQHLLSFFDNRLINEHNIIIAKDKHMIAGNVLIDDAPHNLSSINAYAIQYSQPWNKDCDCSNSIAENWCEVYDYIKWYEQILNI